MRTSSGRDERPATDPTPCKFCRGDLLWVTSIKSGKRFPVDAVPDNRPPPNGGTLVLSLHGGPFGELMAEKFWDRKHDAKRNRYTLHECPNRST